MKVDREAVAQSIPRDRMFRALAEFSNALQELPPAALWTIQDNDAPLPAMLARMAAAGYRQIAKDLDRHADSQSTD